ncbi:MAG: hypothetical protein CMQ73_06955, partial [Gammaproteobacteria bacterium]
SPEKNSKILFLINVSTSLFFVVLDQSSIKSYASSKNNKRIFCENCGSNVMFIDGRDPDGFYIAMGLINGEPDLPLAHHIFVGSKAPWHEINDDLRQHDGDPY